MKKPKKYVRAEGAIADIRLMFYLPPDLSMDEFEQLMHAIIMEFNLQSDEDEEWLDANISRSKKRGKKK